ncbi:hypothetical protein CBM2589_B180126 [Cupriavidus taiwanensis]|uniref:Uncharacterized protein n=1 Tax=Cupriavidus taiwanensis TaxID=164546 RepID=A0A975WXD3_9BURK|nr:hypothetical protein CBM2589_B180126 [Cupriavidus taiwanensis]
MSYLQYFVGLSLGSELEETL